MPVSKEFVLAGHAIFTVGCPDGDHYTFRVDYVEPNGRYGETWFVKTLVGPDNTSDYAYVGRLDPATGVVTTTGKSRHMEDQYRFRLLNRVLLRVWADDHTAYEQHGFSTYHVGRCGRCGRTLTVPESVESGIGPECARRMAAV